MTSADIVAIIAIIGAFVTTVGGVITTVILNRAQARKMHAETEKIETESRQLKEREESAQLKFLKGVGEMYDAAIARAQTEIMTLKSGAEERATEQKGLEAKYSDLDRSNRFLRQAIIKFVNAFEVYISNAKTGARLDEIQRQLSELKATLNSEDAQYGS